LINGRDHDSVCDVRIRPLMPIAAACGLLIVGGTGCGKTSTSAPAAGTDVLGSTATTIDSASAQAAEVFWEEDLARFREELGQGPTGDEPFIPGQLYPQFIIDQISAGNDDLEASMLDAAESLVNCRSKLKALGPPPNALDRERNERELRAFEEACTHYEAAGKLFARGIEQRNTVLMGAAYPFIRDGDKVLCAAGIGAFTCRGRG
jgi:hypothetical protein